MFTTRSRNGDAHYPCNQALGADFARRLTPAPGDTAIVTVHDVAAGGVRREVEHALPALKDPGFRLVVHQLATACSKRRSAWVAPPPHDPVRHGRQGVRPSIRTGPTAARVVERSPSDVARVGGDGRRFSYMEFWQGHGRPGFVQDVMRTANAACPTRARRRLHTGILRPPVKTAPFSAATEEGTDLYTVNIKEAVAYSA